MPKRKDESKIDDKTAKKIIVNLRQNVPPKRNLDLIAVGIDEFWEDLNKDIRLISGTDNGLILYLMGDYGEGKTFICNYLKEKLSYEKEGKKYISSYVEGDFKVLANKRKIYKEIVNNIRIPSDSGDKFGLEPLFERMAKSFKSEKELKRTLRERNVNNTIISKLLNYYNSYEKGYDDTSDVVIRWFEGDDNIKADLLHLIDEKGFAKIEENEVNQYLTAINTICKINGYAGLMVLFDEAEERTNIEDEEAIVVLKNLKHFHNKLTNDNRFSQFIFVLAGTEDLWSEYESLDQAEKERLKSQVRKSIPELEKEEFVTLGKKILTIYNKVYGTKLSIDLDTSIKDKMVLQFVEKNDYSTPREFIGSFLQKLDEIRRNVKSNQGIDEHDLESYFN